MPRRTGARAAVDRGLTRNCIAAPRQIVLRVVDEARAVEAHGGLERDRAKRGFGLQIEALGYRRAEIVRKLQSAVACHVYALLNVVPADVVDARGKLEDIVEVVLGA